MPGCNRVLAHPAVWPFAAFSPTADQPAAIRSLAEGLEAGERFQTLLGATGTGKTMAMAGVVGRPDTVHGEEIVAFVSLHPGRQVTTEELVAFAKERIGGYKYPREVRIVGSVPLTPVGKVDRKTIRGML